LLDALKDLIGLLKDIPNHAMWILGGYMFYKLFIVGSIYGCIRLAINRFHEYLLAPKTIIHKWDIGSHFINSETKESLEELLDTLKSPKNRADLKFISKSGRHYIHSTDVKWLRDLAETEIASKMKKETTV
jgi:hypothetical protein